MTASPYLYDSDGRFYPPLAMYGKPVLKSPLLSDGEILDFGSMAIVMNDLTYEAIRLGKSIEETREALLDFDWQLNWYKHPEEAWWEQ